MRHFWKIFKYCAWFSNFRVFSKNIVLTFVCFEKEWRVFRIIYLEIRVPKIRFSLLSRYKQIVDDMIIQTDKNASDIDVENIVNRKVSLSVLTVFSSFWFHFFPFISLVFFTLTMHHFPHFIFTSFFTQFFRWKLLLTRAARTPFLKITMAEEASALQRWLFVKISSKTNRMKDTKRKYV